MKFNTKSPAYVIVYGAVISGIFTAAIMSLHKATGSVVERNELLYEQKGIIELFGLADVDASPAGKVLEIYERQIVELPPVTDPQTGATFAVLAGYDGPPQAGGTLKGYAFQVSGTGFWANISGWLAVTPDLEQIVGITFLAHQETPGLGGRLTETQFRDQFVGLNITPPEPGEPYLYVGGPRREKRWVDSITGATGTSKAVERFVNQDIASFRRAVEAAGGLGQQP